MARKELPGKSLLYCSICLDVFTEPKVLPCCHSFCKNKLIDHVGEPTLKSTPNQSYCDQGEVSEATSTPSQDGQGVEQDPEQLLVCPQCRAEHKINRIGGIDKLLTDFALESQIKEQEAMSEKITAKELHCNACDSYTDTVKIFYKTCSEYLCDECCKSHTEGMKQFKGHNLVAILLR